MPNLLDWCRAVRDLQGVGHSKELGTRSHADATMYPDLLPMFRITLDKLGGQLWVFLDHRNCVSADNLYSEFGTKDMAGSTRIFLETFAI